MGLRISLFFTLFLTLVGSAATVFAANLEFSPLFDIRVRQEMLDGVIHFDPNQDSDRNWIRTRTRAGAKLAGRRHTLELRLANEHRHDLHQDIDFDWDELIVDRFVWSWQVNAANRLSLGRQDIIWPGGFLMLEGHPLDGSRSNYQNAVRLQSSLAQGNLDLAVIRNARRDDFVLIDDQERPLTNAQETGIAARWDRGPWFSTLIWKREDLADPYEPDEKSDTYTLSVGFMQPMEKFTRMIGEIAFQRPHLNFDLDTDFLDGDPGLFDDWAIAGYFSAVHGPWHSHTIEAGMFYYSGEGERLNAFRAPWGNWPKWSELYIYSLIGESTPDRVHVAAWENIAAGRLALRRPLFSILDRQFQLRLEALFLMAPKPHWQGRGVLTQVEVKTDLASGWQAHLLWERLDPESFHDRAVGPTFIDEPVHFVRWQLSYAFR